MIIEAGDLVGVQGAGELSDLIRQFTGNGPFSHIAVVVATEPFVMVAEALSRVVIRSWEDRLDDAQHLWLLKSPLPLADRVDACRILVKHNGEDYGYSNIVFQALDGLEKTRWWTEHWIRATTNIICSEYAAIAEAKLGLRPTSATPNDFYGWWLTERWAMEQRK